MIKLGLGGVGKLLSLWFCFLFHSILFFISQTSYSTYKIISSYELARPVMGTIFLVAWLAMLFGINSTSDARNSTRRSRVLFVALRVLLIPNSMANRAITC